MPHSLTLIIGNKNYSSWSLRPWLLLRYFRVPFEELRLPLDTPEFLARIGGYSPSGRVPALHHGKLVVWDSLAILEYVNETFLAGRGWPVDPAIRAVARAVSAEMHSGFASMRAQLPMNCVKRVRAVELSADTARDLERITSIWRSARARYGTAGPFLFGEFSIADAMYAPVVSRFVSYGVALGPVEQAFADAVLALPAMQAWLADAAAEGERSASHERASP